MTDTHSKTHEIQRSQVGHVLNNTQIFSDVEKEPLPATVHLDVLTKPKRSINLQFDKIPAFHLGRLDEENLIELDMVPHGAFELGVSRRHARFSRTSDGIFVEDLGSTNGTRINGFVLRPNKTYRLRHNDEIEFGHLRTVIRFSF